MNQTLEFKTPDQIADEYLLYLKAQKSSVNDKQEDSDWYIKSRTYGGVVAGAYSDLRKISDDAFPQSSRKDATERHLVTYFGSGFRPAVKSNGFVVVQGPPSQLFPIGQEFIYNPNGNSYVSTDNVTLPSVTGDSATAQVPVQSIGTGQSQNLLEGAVLSLSAPPVGFENTATVYGGPLADGSNSETNEEGSARVLARIRNPVRGGTADDYEQWAVESDPAVNKATVLRFPNGFGSVGVVITAGTTDIDAAIDNGDPIVVTPSPQLIAIVQAYLETKRPVTDCVRVLSPVETTQDVTVMARFSQGDKDTILAGQTLTQGELVEREVRRALYKHPVGGRKFGATGFVVASEIEEVIDQGLSSEPYVVGSNPILVDRFVEDLSASGRNRRALSNEVIIPGNISIVEF